MDANNMLARGIVWCKTADRDAGWELVEALGSPDPELRQFAQYTLLERRDEAMELLEDAIAVGVLTPEMAGPCMVELIRAGGSDPYIALTNDA